MSPVSASEACLPFIAALRPSDRQQGELSSRGEEGERQMLACKVNSNLTPHQLFLVADRIDI